MSKIDKKLEQIKLQHQIGELLLKDNGVSCHFDYHVNLLSDYETIKLNILTYNKRHNEYMLLHTAKGTSSIDCLSKSLTFLNQKDHSGEQVSFSVKWRKTGDTETYVSYFQAHDDEEARKKFFHEKDPREYEVEVTENPVS